MARGNTILLREAYGLADRNKKIPNTVGTRFRTASISKMFTAVAILRLVQEGKLNLDDPIGRIVPALAGKPVAHVTIQQLLTHTSGTGDIYGPRLDEHRGKLLVHEDFVNFVWWRCASLRSRATKYEYSNLRLHLSRRGNRTCERQELLRLHPRLGVHTCRHDTFRHTAEGCRNGMVAHPATTGRPARENGCQRRNFSTTVAMAQAAPGPQSMTLRDSLARCARNRLLSEKYTKLMFTPTGASLARASNFDAGVYLESYPGALSQRSATFRRLNSGSNSGSVVHAGSGLRPHRDVEPRSQTRQHRSPGSSTARLPLR